ncbi:FHA domain-containing protein [Merismopedia glauca]|uniref:Phosphopeptide-binding protein n=1 Tax=Merismopedia glauca CCAP 1448/3 TaxID=1296344 RepID=A0A2T1C0L0_9CYAN|nr:FHA domain-containing protein [Merismopedia glauca]PSB01801.1 phosphopeptide-binding protein [Merismopedia glauca CCAP 1448/3]
MITLTLLHPLQSIPVQSWTFESETVVRIGRAVDNDVVLYSAVVSRYHVELRAKESNWEVVSIGANGTYFDGKSIDQVPVTDGMVFRLASSGPQIQVRLGAVLPPEKQPLQTSDTISPAPEQRPIATTEIESKSPWYDTDERNKC